MSVDAIVRTLAPYGLEMTLLGMVGFLYSMRALKHLKLEAMHSVQEGRNVPRDSLKTPRIFCNPGKLIFLGKGEISNDFSHRDTATARSQNKKEQDKRQAIKHAIA